MKVNQFFSVTDFFNYYIAGVLWLCNFGLTYFVISAESTILEGLEQLNAQLDLLGTVFIAVLVVVLPYTLGFVASPLGELVMKLFYSDSRNNPAKWAIREAQDGQEKYEGKRLAKPVVEKVQTLAQDVFDVSFEKKHLWFFPIRAYTVNRGGEASQLAIRAQILMNFAESLVVAAPLFAGLLGWLVSPYISNSLCFKVAFSILLVVLILFSLKYRYLKLRERWVKHTYRAFLVLRTQDLQDKKAADEKNGDH